MMDKVKNGLANIKTSVYTLYIKRIFACNLVVRSQDKA
jgi:hypothetical protein